VSLSYQSAVFIHFFCTPEHIRSSYHHYCKCAAGKNVAKNIKNSN
jgi:hypothetical protein